MLAKYLQHSLQASVFCNIIGSMMKNGKIILGKILSMESRETLGSHFNKLYEHEIIYDVK